MCFILSLCHSPSCYNMLGLLKGDWTHECLAVRLITKERSELQAISNVIWMLKWQYYCEWKHVITMYVEMKMTSACKDLILSKWKRAPLRARSIPHQGHAEDTLQCPLAVSHRFSVEESTLAISHRFSVMLSTHCNVHWLLATGFLSLAFSILIITFRH